MMHRGLKRKGQTNPDRLERGMASRAVGVRPSLARQFSRAAHRDPEETCLFRVEHGAIHRRSRFSRGLMRPRQSRLLPY
jgi:hypothetical protein